VSPYEHHSNILPWKEIGAEFIYASDSENSSLDLNDLETKIMKYKNDKRVKIGSFTCASNVTGILLDVEKIAILLHKYNFLSFWDYSTAAPHTVIDMHPNKPLLE
jgi:selenocysteine lyase/cysteine desulfurase